MTPEKQKIKELLEHYFYVVDKESQDVQFKLNPAQQKFLEEMSGRDLILKARQLGFSTLILAIFTYDFLFKKNSISMSISYETGAAQKLLDKVKHFIEPLGVPMKYNSRNEMFNEQMQSTFYIGTAAAVTTGRGQTIHNLHASEAAFYSNADTLMTGLLQSVPKDGRVIIESTANGMGNYLHREWQKAKNNQSAYKPHFFPWYEDKTYSIEPDPTWKPSEQDKKDKADYKLKDAQLYWRFNKMKEFVSDDTFKQEYPMTDYEAFISSGNPYFDMGSLREYMDKTKKPKFTGNLIGNKYKMFLEQTDNGYISVWEEPKDGEEYTIGADVAETTDFSSAHVIKKTTAEVVATWHGHVDADAFGRELERLGYYYNTAMIAVERNNQGIATLVVLNQLYYPMLYYREDINDTGENSTTKLGWETNVRTKPILLSDLAMFIRTRSLILHEKETVEELMTFIRNKTGSGQAEEGCHDDRVMSLAIALQVYKRTPVFQSKNRLVTNAITDTQGTNDFRTYGDAFKNY